MKSPRLWNLQNKGHMNNAGFTVACNIHNMKNHSVDNLTDDMYCHKYMTVKCQTELRERAKPNSTEAAQTLVSVLRALLITSLNCRSCSSFSLSSSYTDRHHINVTSPSSQTASKYNQPLPSRKHLWWLLHSNGKQRTGTDEDAGKLSAIYDVITLPTAHQTLFSLHPLHATRDYRML